MATAKVLPFIHCRKKHKVPAVVALQIPAGAHLLRFISATTLHARLRKTAMPHFRSSDSSIASIPEIEFYFLQLLKPIKTKRINHLIKTKKNKIQCLLTPKQKMSYIKHLLYKVRVLKHNRQITSYNHANATASPINEETR